MNERGRQCNSVMKIRWQHHASACRAMQEMTVPVRNTRMGVARAEVTPFAFSCGGEATLLPFRTSPT